jgi:hypothetical protein
MAAGLEERIGGNLPASVIHQLYELMQHAPVQPAIRMLERRVTLAFQVLEVDQKDPLIWVCLNAWLEVRKCNSREEARETDDDSGCWQRDKGHKTSP